MDSSEPESSWQSPPPELILDESTIHVWCASLDRFTAPTGQLFSILSTGEPLLMPPEPKSPGKLAFTIRRALQRMILGRYLHLDPTRLVFSEGVHGKPALVQPPGARPLHFNLSDSAGLALFAVTRSAPLGVDVEHIEPIRERESVAAGFFSAREKAAFNGLPESGKNEAFFNCWTRKEAYLKATGEGISDALSQVEVTLAPNDPPRLLSIAGDTKTAAKWRLHSLKPAPDFVAALAVKAMGLNLSRWRWPENRAREGHSIHIDRTADGRRALAGSD